MSRARLGCCLLALAVAGPALAQGPAPLVITLRRGADAEPGVVRVEHVASVAGGTATLRDKVAKLDLLELDAQAEGATVTRQEVHYRVQLAGVNASEVRVEGEPACAVRVSRETLTVPAVLAAAHRAVVQRLPGAGARVTARPVEPVLLPVVPELKDASVRLQATVPAGRLPLGRVPVEVGVYVNGQRRHVIALKLDVTLQPRGAGEDGPAARPGGVIPASGTQEAAAEVVIRPRDAVTMIAQLGRAYATAAGEALQEGRVGQSVRVRNVDSGRVVQGRVIGPGLVEVEY